MKPGDIVKLKSGGPSMTLIRIEGTSMICIWFDKDDHLCTGNFTIDSIKG